MSDIQMPVAFVWTGETRCGKKGEHVLGAFGTSIFRLQSDSDPLMYRIFEPVMESGVWPAQAPCAVVAPQPADGQTR